VLSGLLWRDQTSELSVPVFVIDRDPANPGQRRNSGVPKRQIYSLYLYVSKYYRSNQTKINFIVSHPERDIRIKKNYTKPLTASASQ
jgi:hypothetical protein